MTSHFIPVLLWRLLFLFLALVIPHGALHADITGFGAAGAGFSLNGGATVNNGVAMLTDGGINEARSVFYGSRQTITGFNVSFTYRESASVVATGEGIAFVVQNDSRQAQAVGRNGTSLGYGGGLGSTAVSPSASVQFNLLNVAGLTASSTGFATNGALTGTPYGLASSTNLGGGAPIQVNLRYDGTTLTETLTNLASGAVSPTYSYAAGNLSSLLGSDTAYIGFTGSTGLLAATQTVSDFSFVAVPESSAWGMMAGGTLLMMGASRLCRSRAWESSAVAWPGRELRMWRCLPRKLAEEQRWDAAVTIDGKRKENQGCLTHVGVSVFWPSQPRGDERAVDTLVAQVNPPALAPENSTGNMIPK